jgi:hypothetical protein
LPHISEKTVGDNRELYRGYPLRRTNHWNFANKSLELSEDSAETKGGSFRAMTSPAALQPGMA